LLPGSPAINAGTCQDADGNTLTVDQRGVLARPQGPECDIGAYEAPVNPLVTKVQDTNDGTCNTDCSLREAISVAVYGSKITVPVGTYTLTLGAELTIDDHLVIISKR
jgi:CSLREA domain-containing protein